MRRNNPRMYVTLCWEDLIYTVSIGVKGSRKRAGWDESYLHGLLDL
jgi:hypothetical protein